jgi:hypothetical protein
MFLMQLPDHEICVTICVVEFMNQIFVIRIQTQQLMTLIRSLRSRSYYVLFLEFFSVVAISSGFYSGARGFCVYLYCKVKGKGKVRPISGHEGLEVLYAFV